MDKLDKFAGEISDFVEEMGWKKDWLGGGCYIHLEASEFIEALRGKGDPIEELGDVFITIFSVCAHYGITPSEGVVAAKKKMKKVLETRHENISMCSRPSTI